MLENRHLGFSKHYIVTSVKHQKKFILRSDSDLSWSAPTQHTLRSRSGLAGARSTRPHYRVIVHRSLAHTITINPTDDVWPRGRHIRLEPGLGWRAVWGRCGDWDQAWCTVSRQERMVLVHRFSRTPMGGRGQKDPPLPKICRTYPTMRKLGTIHLT